MSEPGPPRVWPWLGGLLAVAGAAVLLGRLPAPGRLVLALVLAGGVWVVFRPRVRRRG